MGDDGGRPDYVKPLTFLILSEFCERFCYYGLRTVLVLYMSEVLKFPESKLTVCLHVFVFVASFTPIIGGMIADSWLGKYKTTVVISLLYIIGCFVLSWGTMETLNIWQQPKITYFGMTLVAVTSGMVKPCRAAIGGDQYKLPEQQVPFSRYFTIYVFAVNIGSIMSRLTSPLLGEKIPCLKEDTCYPLAFGIPGLLMVISWFIFASGYNAYVIHEPDRNIFTNLFGCIFRAMRNRIINFTEQKAHWLDFAADKYDQAFINDVKLFIKLLVVFTPIPLFWSLYEQQYTGWYYQARMMRGELGDYTILPQNMQLANPILVVILIILFEYMFYPCLEKCNLHRPLQKMCCGGFFAAVAFIISGFLSLSLEKGPVPEPHEGVAHIRIYNNVYCDVKLTFTNLDQPSFELNKHGIWAKLDIEACGIGKFNLKVEGPCMDAIADQELEYHENSSTGYFFQADGNEGKKKNIITFQDDARRNLQGLPKVRFLTDYKKQEKHHVIHFTGKYYNTKITNNVTDYESVYTVKPDTYTVKVHESVIEHMQFILGGVYAVLVVKNSTDYPTWIPAYTPSIKPYNVHMLWQVPQYIFLSAGEVMFSITGMEFAYSESPIAMKATGQALFLITYAVGHLIGMFISAMEIYEELSSTFFFYGGLMVIDMFVFACFAMYYRYETAAFLA